MVAASASAAAGVPKDYRAGLAQGVYRCASVGAVVVPGQDQGRIPEVEEVRNWWGVRLDLGEGPDQAGSHEVGVADIRDVASLPAEVQIVRVVVEGVAVTAAAAGAWRFLAPDAEQQRVLLRDLDHGGRRV